MNTAAGGRPAGAAALAVPRSMRAIVQHRYGSAPGEVFRLEQTAPPPIGDDEVLVRVHAAGLDRGTRHLMVGQPYLMRIAGAGFRRPKNPVPGMDLAGTVAAAGANVTRFRPGDQVFGVGRGAFAEYAAARADMLAAKPDRLSFEQAAVVAVSGLTAVQGLRTGRIKPGQQVLVIGASGGVGSYAVQLAKAAGAQVTGVASTAKAGLVASMGADHVIDYTREDFADGRRRYDLILDIGGSSRLSRLRRALAPTGTLVIVGGKDARWAGLGRQLRALVLSPAGRQRLTTFVSIPRRRQADLGELSKRIEAGDVTPVVDETYPLAEAARAMGRLQAGQVRGKLAITI